jgi:heptosyltransferase-1
MAAMRRALRVQRYDVILNLQEQVKGALVSWFAQGTRHGLDRANIREPIATLVDHVHHPVSRDLHIVDRCRGLAAAALGYSASGPPRWNFAPPPAVSAMPAGPYALAFHATSRPDKQWPEEHWRALVTHFTRAGFVTLLPWGNADEEARSRRIADGTEGAAVPPRQTLPELATLTRNAEIAVGVDTGLTHLAAALGTPTVAIFTATDPRLAGVSCAGPHAQDAGGNGSVPPLDAIVELCGQLLRQMPRC